MNVLVTGGCGFVGSNLALALKADGHQVTCFDNLSRRGAEVILERILAEGCMFTHGDVRNVEDLDRLQGAFSLLIECSAEPSVMAGAGGDGARYMIENNLVGAVNCLEYARLRQMPLLFMSTSRVYPYNVINSLCFQEAENRVECKETRPGLSSLGIAEDFPLVGVRSLYGATKLAAEMLAVEYAAQYGMRVLINRCGLLAGPWQMGKSDQGVIAFWMAAHLLERKLSYIGFGGQGRQVRDVLHIADFVALVRRQIADFDAWHGNVYNVGGGMAGSISLKEATKFCGSLTGKHLHVGNEPATRPADVIWYVTDNTLVSKTFKWAPERSPEQTLSDIRDWMLSLGRPGLSRLFK